MNRTWSWRLLCGGLYLLTLWLLPQTVEEGASVLLRRQVARKLFSSWNQQVEEYGRLSARLRGILAEGEDAELEDALRAADAALGQGSLRAAVEGLSQVAGARGVSAGASLGEIFHSFAVGSERAIPPPLPCSIPVNIGSFRDDSGVHREKQWQRSDLIALLQSGDFGHLEIVAGSGSVTGVPAVDFVISRRGRAIEARCESPGGGDPTLAIRLEPEAALRPVTDLDLTATTTLPTKYSLLPPITAIFCALLTRRAVLSLFVGILAGALVLVHEQFATSVGGGFQSLAGTVTNLYWVQIKDQLRLSIILFVLFLVGMVGVMTRSGGTQGLVNLLTRFSTGVRSTRIVTALMGFVVFFDDYSNSVIVGSSMRPLSDKMRIAREKLAYIIDSTAAPVAGIALFSTWIGYEISQYMVALAAIDPELSGRAYSIFLQTIPFRFYCIFTLIFVLANVILARDYGSMYRAEVRAAIDGKVIADGARPLTTREFSELRMKDSVLPRARNAVLPLAVVLLTMIVGFWVVGEGLPRFQREGWSSLAPRSFGEILNNNYNLWVTVVAATMGSVVAIGMVLVARALSLGEALHAWFVGFRSIGIAVVILFSAWAIAGACDELQTRIYLGSILGDSIPLVWLPVLIFLLSCALAFATGTSWGTMAILLPISIPLVYYAEGSQLGLVTLISFGAVLEGSIFGDHCSPISDTTVLASVSAGSDHIDHVRTQVPYALTTMAIAIVVGYIPVSRGWYSGWTAILLGAGACVAVLLLVGKRTPEPRTEPATRDRLPAEVVR